MSDSEEPRTLTVARLRALLSQFPDELPRTEGCAVG